MAALPRLVVPIRLFCTVAADARTMFSRFPEMVLALTPGIPIRVPVPLTRLTPSPLGRAVVPRLSVPTSFPSSVSLTDGVVVVPICTPTPL